MKRRGDQDYLRDILEMVALAQEFVQDIDFATFERDRKTQMAVLRSLEVMGEAVKQLSTELRTRHPDVPWREIAGMRDKLIHDYIGVNLSRVWRTVKEDLPRLSEEVREMLEA